MSRGGPRLLVTVLRTYLTSLLGLRGGFSDGPLCGRPIFVGLRTRPSFHGQFHCHFLLKKNPPLSHRLAVLVWTDTGLEPGHMTPDGNQGENAVYVHWVLDSQGSLVITIVLPVGRARQRVRPAQGRAGLRDGPSPFHSSKAQASLPSNRRALKNISNFLPCARLSPGPGQASLGPPHTLFWDPV